MTFDELTKCLYEIKSGFGGIDGNTTMYFLDSQRGRLEIDDMAVGQGRICFVPKMEEENDN